MNGDGELEEVRLEGSRVYDGKVVHLDVDRVRLADGSEAVREVVRHPGAAVIVPVLDDGRVLLVRQFRYPTGGVLLELPAGTVASGDADALECARRELAEETGHRAAAWRHLATFYSAPGFTDERVSCYLALGLTPTTEGSLDEDERIDVVAVPLDEAESMARRGELHDAKSIAGVLLARGALR